jgi:hypothetical protein
VSIAGIMVLAVAFVGVDGRTMARAQGGRAPDQRPAQGTNAPGTLNPYAALPMRGSFSPYLVKDPTADERAAIAGRIYRAILDESVRKAGTSPRPGGGPPDVEARSSLELIERLGPWSLRWQEAQDNAARSKAARYRSLSDHLGRMSDLEQGRSWREAGQAKAAGGPADPRRRRVSADAARSFRPIDGWTFDQIVPTRLQSGRPLNPVGVGVSPARQAEIAGRVYRAILDDAVGRFLASPREGEPRRPEEANFDAVLAERLAFWSDLWSRSQDAADGRTSAIRSHVERMSDLENGRFADVAIERAGRPAAGSVDMTRFREFAEVARFFRLEAESRLPGGSSSREADDSASGQAATAGRIYRAILDGAVRRGGADADARLVFDSRLAERLAAWSAHWARAQIRADWSRASQFAAARSHVERMAALEEGRALRDAVGWAGLPDGGRTALAPPRDLADVARFFRLEALWDLAQIKSR